MEIIKVVNARQVLESLADREDIGTHLSYWMTKFIVQTQSEYDFYIKEMRKLFEKYGTYDEENRLVVSTEHLAEFQSECQKLENTNVEVPSIRFPLTELAQELKLSMKQIYPLLDFINEDV